MPHAIHIESSATSARSPKSKTSLSKELRQLHILYDKISSQYLTSNLQLSIARLIDNKNRPKITKVISLGLGSLTSTNQNRRLKQLIIFLAIADQLQQTGTNIGIYAQDPSFSKTDEAFLQSLGVNILSTPSASESGQAAHHIDETTLVYCPFLTLEAYRLFFSTEVLHFFIGDDFDALRNKWPKHSSGRNEAELILRRFVQGLSKRAIAGDERFWDAEDKPFPMAMYWTASNRSQGKSPKAKL